MEDRLVIVARFGSSAEAHAARLALDGEGIEARVGDDAAADMLSIMASGLGGAKLLVWQRDEQRARAILEQEERNQKPPLPPWICHACGSRVDAGFEVCWSCGVEYDPQRSARAPYDPEEEAERQATESRRRNRVSHPQPAPTEEPPPLPPLAPGEWRCPACGLQIDESFMTCPACGAKPESPPNPYLPPRVESEPVPPRVEPVERYERRPEEFDPAEAVMRAWRSAILGLVVCPGVLHIYSLYLLARVAMSGEELPPHLNWRFYFALAIDLLFPFLILVSFQMMYYSSYSFLGI